MQVGALLLVAVAGYLIGSISFARVLVRAVKPSANLDQARSYRSETGESGTVSGIGASTASIALGKKYGPVVGILDMLKTLVPILVLQATYPGQPYGLVFSILAIAGHIYPFYYRFVGGRGLSPMLGSLLVIEPIGMVVSILAGTAISIVINRPHTALIIWFPVLTLWAWFVRADAPLTIYTIVLMLLFVMASIPETRLARRYWRQGRMDAYNEMIMDSAPQMRMMQSLAARLRFWESSHAGAEGERE